MGDFLFDVLTFRFNTGPGFFVTLGLIIWIHYWTEDGCARMLGQEPTRSVTTAIPCRP